MKRMLLHPSSGSRLPAFFRLQREGKSRDSSPSFSKIGLAATCMLARNPFFALEDAVYGRRIHRQSVESGPVFIVGHWRSGTTFLHNLLSADERFGYLNTAQVVAPNGMLLSRYLPVVPLLLRLRLPGTRKIDDVELTLEAPQEEEIALGILSGISYYNCYYFPRRFTEFFDDAIGTEELDAHRGERFADAYRNLVKKLTYLRGGKPLLLKNPSSTARIRFLKDLFPGAKFIHIRRNPYEVFASSLARLPTMIDAFQLRRGPEPDYEGQVIRCYRKLMQSFLRQRDSIPSEDLVEISYEDLVARPRGTVAEIYDHLGIPRNDTSLANLDAAVRKRGTTAGGRHRISRRQIERIEREWRFALEEWNYERSGDVRVVDEPGGIATPCPQA